MSAGTFRINSVNGIGIRGTAELQVGAALVSLTARSVSSTITVARIGRPFASRSWGTVTPTTIREALRYAERLNANPKEKS